MSTPGITPTTIYTDTDINCSSTYTDADSNVGTVYLKGYVNGTLRGSKTFTSVATGTTKTWEFTAANFTRGERLNCSAYANDGTVDGATVWSSTYTVGNRAPTLVDKLTFGETTQVNPPTTEDLYFNLSCNDIDESDSVTGKVQLYNGSVAYGGLQSLGLTKNIEDTIATLNSSFTKKGETWTGEFYCTDGTLNTAHTNSSVTISNTAPTTPTAESLTNPVYVSSVLTASGSGSSDSDGDSLTYYYEFYNNNDLGIVQAYSTTATYTIQVTDAHDTLRVRTKAYDGASYSGEYTATRDVSNTLPTIPGTLTINASIKVGQLLQAVCSGSTDADNDALTYYLQFYNINDGAVRQAYSTTTSYTITVADAHDLMNVTCKSYDSLGYSATVKDATITVSDTVPIDPTDIAGFPGSLKMGNTLTVTSSGATDADGDAITAKYKFYNMNDSATRQDWSATNTYVIAAADAHDVIRVYARSDTALANSPGTYSETDIVDDTAPIDPTSVTGFPANSYTGTTLTMTASGATDADSDSITYQYKFYNNNDGTILQDWSATNTYTILYSDAHDVIRVYAKAITLRANSPGTYYDSDTVENTAPVVTGILPYNNDHHNTAQASYYFNYTDLDQDTANCTLYISSAVEGVKAGVSAYTFIQSTSTLGSGTYQWNVRCFDGYTDTQSPNITNVIDLVKPNINPWLPKYDNSTVIERNFQNLVLNISGNDNYLFAGRVRIQNASGAIDWERNVTGLLGTDYTFDDSINVSGWAEGIRYSNTSFTDDHTAEKIPDYKVTKGSKSLAFETKEGTVIGIEEISSGNAFKSLNTTKLEDRYTFDLELKNAKKGLAFYLTSTSKIWYRGNLYPYPSFVTGMNWVDFNSPDLAGATVTKITDKKYLVEVNLKADTSSIKFNSLGGLNIQTEVYSFLIRQNDPPTIVAMNLTPATVHTDDLIHCNAATADDESDTVSEAYKWYDNAAEVAGQTASTFDCDIVAGCDKGDTMTCEVSTSDPWQDGAAQNSSVVISNSAPTITTYVTSPVFRLDRVQDWDFHFVGADIDLDTLTWSDNTTLFAINSTTGKVNLTTSLGLLGRVPIAITASDGALSASTQFNFTILNTTLSSLTQSIAVPYIIGTNITAYKTLSVDNPNTANDATNQFYNFTAETEWAFKSTEDHNFNVTASGSALRRTNFTMRPAYELSYTPVYSTGGIGSVYAGYRQYTYNVYINVTTNLTEGSSIRYNIPLARMPSSYSSRDIHKDEAYINGSATGVSIANSKNITVTTAYGGAVSLQESRYMFTYKYYSYEGGSGGSGGGGGGSTTTPTTIPYSIVGSGCSLRAPSTEFTFSPSQLSQQVTIQNAGNKSVTPTIEWVEVSGYPYSANGKFAVLKTAVAVLPGKSDTYILRFNSSKFTDNVEKVILRVADGTSCKVDILLIAQPLTGYDWTLWGKSPGLAMASAIASFKSWLTTSLIEFPWYGTTQDFAVTNWMIVVVFLIIGIIVAMLIDVNIVGRIFMGLLSSAMLTIGYAMVMGAIK